MKHSKIFTIALALYPVFTAALLLYGYFNRGGCFIIGGEWIAIFFYGSLLLNSKLEQMRIRREYF